MARFVLGCKQQTKDGATYAVNEKPTSKLTQNLTRLREIVAKLDDDWSNETLLSADTNALIANPNLEDWSFPDITQFTLILTPTVLSELDALKNDRNERVRDKSEKLIRKIKEYGRRGDWHKGVTIKRGISLLLLPDEPSFEHVPSWLDRNVNDDRIIARTINLMKAHPKCAVGLVTRDINVQNKAKHARIHYLEPPQIMPSTDATSISAN